METIFIVIYRYTAKANWQPKTEGCFTDKRMADNYAEILRLRNPSWEYAVIEGPICSPQQMAVAEAQLSLGSF